jgi:hypothetical protein
VKIESKDYNETTLTDAFGNSIGYAKGNIRQHISYLSVPLYYGFTLKNFNINLGIQTGYAITSSGGGEANGQVNGDPVHYDIKYNRLPISTVDFGPRAGIFFKIRKLLSLEANYYYGITNIYKDRALLTWKVQQMTCRIKIYYLSTGKIITRSSKLIRAIHAKDFLPSHYPPATIRADD